MDRITRIIIRTLQARLLRSRQWTFSFRGRRWMWLADQLSASISLLSCCYCGTIILQNVELLKFKSYQIIYTEVGKCRKKIIELCTMDPSSSKHRICISVHSWRTDCLEFCRARRGLKNCWVPQTWVLFHCGHSHPRRAGGLYRCKPLALMNIYLSGCRLYRRSIKTAIRFGVAWGHHTRRNKWKDWASETQISFHCWREVGSSHVGALHTHSF
jgi:hypothetical protein